MNARVQSLSLNVDSAVVERSDDSNISCLNKFTDFGFWHSDLFEDF